MSKPFIHSWRKKKKQGLPHTGIGLPTASNCLYKRKHFSFVVVVVNVNMYIPSASSGCGDHAWFFSEKKKTGTNLEFPFVACINNNCHKRHFFLFPLVELWETTNTTKKNSSFLSNMALKYAICWQLWAAATDLLRWARTNIRTRFLLVSVKVMPDI